MDDNDRPTLKPSGGAENAADLPIYQNPHRPAAIHRVRYRPTQEGARLIDVDADGTETFWIARQQLKCPPCDRTRWHDIYLECGDGPLIMMTPKAVCCDCLAVQQGEAKSVGTMQRD